MELKLRGWDNFIYESRPFVYLALGSYTLAADSPNLFVINAAFILIICGLVVMRMRYKNRQSRLDYLFYESLPFLYFAIGVYAIAFHYSSKIAVASGVLLLFCATKVFQWRMKNREIHLNGSRRRGPNNQTPANKSDQPSPRGTNASGR